MNKVVTSRNVKASELPAELRGGIPEHATVTVTVQEEVVVPVEDAVAMLERYRTSAAFRPVTEDEAVGRIRALRDEWDD